MESGTGASGCLLRYHSRFCRRAYYFIAAPLNVLPCSFSSISRDIFLPSCEIVMRLVWTPLPSFLSIWSIVLASIRFNDTVSTFLSPLERPQMRRNRERMQLRLGAWCSFMCSRRV